MFIKINGRDTGDYSRGGYVQPLEVCEPVMVHVDPSKTNMGIIIANEFGKVYNKINMGAPGKENDNIDYCYDFYEYLTAYLSKIKIAFFSLEEPVTEQVDRKRKKDTEYEKQHKSKGNHVTNKTLMYISAKMVDVCIKLTGRKPFMINNWVWKNAILPKEYRSGEYAHSKKGSVPYIQSKYPEFIGYDDNITDAFCMHLYCRQFIHKVEIYCNAVEETTHKYNYIITDESKVPLNAPKYKYNYLFTIEENLNYFINRIRSIGCFELPIDRLTVNDLIGHCANLTTHSKPYILIIPEGD